MTSYPKIVSGWWLTYPSEKYEFVSWDDQIPNWMESQSKFHGSMIDYDIPLYPIKNTINSH